MHVALSIKGLLGMLTPGLQLPRYWQERAFQLEAKWQLSIALMLNLLSLAMPK